MGLLDKLFSKPPSRNDFAKLVIKSLARCGVENVTYQESDFSLKIGAGNNLVFLTNGYASYCNADRSAREAVLSQFASASASALTTSVPQDFQSAKPNLMPVVRDPSYYSLTHLQRRVMNSDDPKYRGPTKPLATGLVVGLAYDTERTILQVNGENLDQWGISLEEAIKQAKDNLRDKTDPFRMVEQAPGIYLGRWGDSYESSRMLLTDLVYRLSVDGEPVAFVPSRDQLWVTGKDNTAGLGTILKIGEQSHFEAHPVSPNLYRLSDGEWSVYAPEEPAWRDLWLSIKRRRDALDYGQQKQYLDAIHEREKIDIFVANYSVFEAKDGGSRYSLCVWSNGVDSLLPQAEHIAFLINQEKKDHVIVPWEAALSILSNLMEEEAGLSPVRFRVHSFPNQEQVEALRTAAQTAKA